MKNIILLWGGRKHNCTATHPHHCEKSRYLFLIFFITNFTETTNNKNYSEEDWDSDDYLEPSCSSQYLHSFRSPSPATLWKNYVIRKMAEGNFCPVDMHTVPIMEQVLCYKARHPQKSINEELYLNDTSDDDSV